ncbi:MAG: DUF2723 domain-containing protein [Alistipes sp.]|nr:DUF2723 domain-containing protein [Alistipes sp.]
MNRFKRWNNLVGWAVFAIAALTYLLTMEPSSSLWDCSEFIATSYKLEVGHPPGAPLFMLLARLATMLAPSTHYVPHMVNAMNCLASAFCILFLFWTITHLARRIVCREQQEFTTAGIVAVLGTGLVGALAYTFTDTFWFSAVEGEVYALSSLFTALVVWLMLKWEDQADQPHAARWIVLIAYLMGLSIGVHLLNLLTIPALGLIYYFRTTERITLRGIALNTLASGAILLFIYGCIFPWTVQAGAWVDLLLVNGLGLPVNLGITLFTLALLAALGTGVYLSHRKGRRVLNLMLLSTLMIVIGFSSYASVTIRAAANPPMNSNNPDNPFALISLLNRDQYGDKPLLYGPQFTAPAVGYKYRDIRYLGEDGKYETATLINGAEFPPQFMHLFPRMWNSHTDPESYKSWSAYRTRTDYRRNEQGEIVRDALGRPETVEVLDFGRPVVWDDDPQYEPIVIVEPTFLENLNYFFTYQLSHMYWRYFLWNFVGRQSDIQPDDAIITDGNWLSGIRWIDELYLGPQTDLPDEIAGNKGRNTYYFLPFLLGLVGLLYQLQRDPRNFSVVMWLFLMMGVVLVLYFNSSPNEPRERDYIYAGSFYAFCIWIGIGVLAVRDLIVRLTKRRGAAAPIAATLLCLAIPGILAAENWDDHDRSHRTIARDIGWNYLQSVLPNAIVVNFGDNDTFPLWFNQEVDGVRTDVRVMNTSYLGAEWYIDQMKVRSNEAPGVPFSLPRSKYAYTNDVLRIVDQIDRPIDLREAIDFIRSEDPRTKITMASGRKADYLPGRRFSLPVDKENAIASGIVKEKDRHLMVDTIYFELPDDSIDKSGLMLLDMLAHFDWKRPIHFTQVFMLRSLGLLDYLQFDGYSYRLVPIYTPLTSAREIGRIDPDVVVPLLTETFRYGNLADPRVYVDDFIHTTLNAAQARQTFARTAKELLVRGDTTQAVRLLDMGLEKLPAGQIRYSESNTVPFIECYYYAGETDKGDALLLDYADNLMQYIDHYLRFEGIKGDMVTETIIDKMQSLERLYYLAVYAGRKEAVARINDYYRTLGALEEELIHPDWDPSADSVQLPAAASHQ